MYHQIKFKFKNHLKLNIHRQIHANTKGCRVATLEGKEVRLAAWRHIMEVPETTFYCYTRYEIEGGLVQKHKNCGLFKLYAHTLQVTATLWCIQDRFVDHMLHRF
jgi:hypothetical protein